mmetsp:Transcript_14899/g.31664  ORF Transcript_14899/g.31664 Transcript_14899/m.31664 type:complete len:551 (+) Transcript_14899:109-1761(+)
MKSPASSMPATFLPSSPPPLLLLLSWVILVAAVVNVAEAGTIRYRPGHPPLGDNTNSDGDGDGEGDGVLEQLPSTTVPRIREKCRTNPSCVAFSYFSPESRFPYQNVTAYLFRYPDWHYRYRPGPAGRSEVFVEDRDWHTYVNVTREREALPGEVAGVMKAMMELDAEAMTAEVASTMTSIGRNGEANEKSGSRLRGGGSRSSQGETRKTLETASSDWAAVKQKRLELLDALFGIVLPSSEHKALATPLVAPSVLSLAALSSLSSDNRVMVGVDDDVRQAAMRVLIVLGDTHLTGPALLDAGVYHAMRRVVEDGLRKPVPNGIEERDGNDSSGELALDVISNICLHRSVNSQLRAAGAHTFLREVARERDGFLGLQATLALTHIGDEGFDVVGTSSLLLPESKIADLVGLLRSTIDGDVVYGIKWDLLPGPLSSIKYLVLHAASTTSAPTTARGEKNAPDIIGMLLDAGLFDQLLRILEADTLVSDHVEAALEVMAEMTSRSDRARHMVVFAEHSLENAEERLRRYGRAAGVAGSLVKLTESFSFGDDEF